MPVRRQFCLTHTVRYDECNNHGYLTPTAFVRYMQDLAARDAEDARLSGNGYWVVKRSVITFARPVRIHTQLELKTYGIGFTRITAQRGYEAHLAGENASEPVISARSLWVYIDSRGRPARLPEETAAIWLPDGPLAQQPEVPLPAPPEKAPEVASASVHFSDIDLAGHLNNASAVKMLDDAAWEMYTKGGITPGTAKLDPLHYDIEYADSPLFGENLEIQTWLEPLPVPGQEFSSIQQISRAGKLMIRSHSRWFYQSM